MKKMTPNPMQSAHAARRCSAKSKRSGKDCNAPAVRGFRVCRMHGAGGGAPRGEHHGHYKHGGYTCEVISAKRGLALLLAAVAPTGAVK
ncbi:MAG: hypothetical protein EOR30_24110 [Mesorhizobium sp.]|nr:hypothetical protein EOA78_24755 [Mesorhizobium sp. M5C.F.Cr.IN.023.01.1.1]RWF84542.1 MAG: hypothetical protein EOQ36_25605 [Mesorhizobium sp.]RWF90766.1 MAG: hypothetical protein EOQ45_28785 [Mesorhizobium sp.]RWI43511.1 MAG: hypothetical protein EOR14_02765 [Mesorhizobium sp.]RWI44335.1 MAG: hypothetical protein EOR15_26340 [Mesorhizobium sp.]